MQRYMSASAVAASYRHYHYPEARLFRSPHCIETERFAARATTGARQELRSRFGIGSNTPVVLFAGKLAGYKRPLDIIEAVAKLRARGTEAHVLVAEGRRARTSRATARRRTARAFAHARVSEPITMPRCLCSRR